MVARYMIRRESFISEKPSPWNSPHLAKVGLAPVFDLAPDGEHIAALLQADTPESRETLNHVMVMLNFPQEVRRRMEQ
jgi:serine/threonine-protein kinase